MSGESALSAGMLALGRALDQPACPVCRLASEAVDEYLLGLLVSNLNDSKTLARLTRSQGFCPRHTRQFHEEEILRFGDSLASSMLYASILGAVAKELGRWRPTAQARPSRLMGPLQHILQRLGLAQGKNQTSPQLAATEPCPACDCESNAERWYLLGLARGCASAELRRAYARSEGLCLPHLRLALEIAAAEAPEGARFLTDDAARRVAASHADLEGYRSWRARQRASPMPSDAERRATDRAARFLAGEDQGIEPF